MIEPKAGPTYEEGRRGVMNTHSGVRFSLLEPRPEDVHIEDIAWHLSHINRFTGATNAPYNVAEHSVTVYRIVRRYTDDPRVWLAALLHDASEAYTGDASNPLKQAMRAISEMVYSAQRSVFDRIEERVEDAIIRRFLLPVDAACWALVKRADNEAYVEEAEMYMGPNGCAMPLVPKEARNCFLRVFDICQSAIERRTSVAA